MFHVNEIIKNVDDDDDEPFKNIAQSAERFQEAGKANFEA